MIILMELRFIIFHTPYQEKNPVKKTASGSHSESLITFSGDCRKKQTL
jgi:hypothetical protein